MPLYTYGNTHLLEGAHMLERLNNLLGYKRRVTNLLDGLDARPRGKRLAALLTRCTPTDWGNYFS